MRYLVQPASPRHTAHRPHWYAQSREPNRSWCGLLDLESRESSDSTHTPVAIICRRCWPTGTKAREDALVALRLAQQVA